MSIKTLRDKNPGLTYEEMEGNAAFAGGLTYVEMDDNLRSISVSAATPPLNNAANDEFNGTSLDTVGARGAGAVSWQWRNKGDATAVVTQGHLLLTAPGGSPDLRSVTQLVPAGAWRYRALITTIAAPAEFFNLAGLVINNADATRNITFHKSPYALDLGAFRYNNRIWLSTIFNGRGDFGARRSFLAPMWFELDFDGAYLHLRISDCGVDGTYETLTDEPVGEGNFLNEIGSVGIVSYTSGTRAISVAVDCWRAG